MEIPKFKTRKELFNYLIENKDKLVSEKIAQKKEAFGPFLKFSVEPSKKMVKTEAIKEDGEAVFEEVEEEDVLTVKAVINTTKLFDSHRDVHLDGIWDEQLENKGLMNRVKHLQEHKSREFDKIISSGEDLTVSVETVKWTDLGFNYKGTTQALTFVSKVRKNRNPYMYEQYKSGWVDNHSVGMWYGKLDIAIDDEDYPANKDLYDKYIDTIANKEDVEKYGYFWAVFKAGFDEGSAVPNGSNFVTPTQEVIGSKSNSKENKSFESELISFLKGDQTDQEDNDENPYKEWLGLE